jgi:tetratricopeptide (TPR) repeat protein
MRVRIFKQARRVEPSAQRKEVIMCKENLLCKKFLLSADWDRAVAALSEEDEAKWSSADYVNLAHALCFQATKAHSEGNYDDAVAAASKAQIKDCNNNDALRIRAYAYYLNGNYDDAITDCKKVIKEAGDIETKKKTIEDAWKDTYSKPDDKDTLKTAVEAQEAYCKALHCTTFAHELLGIIYSDMDRRPEASENYKLALLARQTDIVPASPLLMDAYRNARAAVKGF